MSGERLCCIYAAKKRPGKCAGRLVLALPHAVHALLYERRERNEAIDAYMNEIRSPDPDAE